MRSFFTIIPSKMVLSKVHPLRSARDNERGSLSLEHLLFLAAAAAVAAFAVPNMLNAVSSYMNNFNE